jgi:hypothetical protein
MTPTSTILKVLALATLTLASIEDWKKESFHPQPAITLTITTTLLKPELITNPATLLTLLLSLIAIHKKYVRIGDLTLLTVYITTIPKIQSLFTLLTVTGIYLETIPKIKTGKKWMAYAPAILISYLIQLTFF